MEHIRKALEQAEKERETARLSSASQVASVPSDAQPADAERAGRDLSDIRFEQTRVIEVPREVLERNRIIAALPEHELSDVYRMLRTRVLQQMRANGWKALAITSPASGHGKSLTAVNLAISLASEVNQTVLLADLDLRNPSIHKFFDYQPTAGLSDYLQHGVPVSEILFSPGIERLAVLPGRESIMNSSETLSSPRMASLVAELKTRYPDRLVICDLPPILATDDALTFAPYSDAMLMVAESGATHRDDLEESLEILKEVPLIGTVLNKAEAGTSRKAYRYGRS